MTDKGYRNPCIMNTRILILLSLIMFYMMFASTDVKAQTWQRMKMELPSGYDRISTVSARFAFATKDIGWFHTSVSDSATGQVKAYYLFKTTNGGDNWAVQRDFGPRGSGRTIFALDTNHVWVGLSHSTDGGNTWPDSISTQPNRLDYREVFFFDSLAGVAVGTIPGTTTDGGRTWTSHDSIPEMLYPTKLSFPTRTQGWATCDGHPGVTDAGSIIHTSAGGATWAFQYPPSPLLTFPRMGSVEFLDSLTGFASSSRMFKTTDGGASWVYQPNTPYGGDFAFLTDNICCLTGTYGVFWYSVDRCYTWISDTTEYMAGFKLFPIRKEGYMFAWGTRSDNNNRELLRGDFRSLTMVEEPNASRGNSGITINAYPNPFYDSVTMNMHGSTGYIIRISVRDLLGREVFHEDAIIPYSGVYTLRWRPTANHLSCASYVVTVSSQQSTISAIIHHMKYVH
jgi:photosystem II stability/assembly factor-like uncharacterized protein